MYKHLSVSNDQTKNINPVIKDELEVENGRVEDNLLLLQLRLQFVLNLTRVDEQHLCNFFHLFFETYNNLYLYF